MRNNFSYFSSCLCRCSLMFLSVCTASFFLQNESIFLGCFDLTLDCTPVLFDYTVRKKKLICKR